MDEQTEQKKDISDQQRLLSNLILVGRVISTRYKESRVMVRIGPDKKKNIDILLPWIRQRGGSDWEWWAPEKDERVVIVSPDGDLDRAIIIGSIPYEKMADSITPEEQRKVKVEEEGKETQAESTSHTVKYQDGTQTSYDKEKHLFQATVKGKDQTPLLDLALSAEEEKGNLTLGVQEGVTINIGDLDDKGKIAEPKAGLVIKADQVAVEIPEKKASVVLKNDGEVTITASDEKAKIQFNPNGEITLTCEKMSVMSNGEIDLNGEVTLTCEKMSVSSNGAIDLNGSAVNLNC